MLRVILFLSSVLLCACTQASYWRLKITTLSTSNWETYIRDLRFYDIDGSLLAGTYSSSAGNGGIGNINDNDMDSSYKFPPGGTLALGDYLQFVCSPACEPAQFELLQFAGNENNRLWGLAVEYSANTGATWSAEAGPFDTNAEDVFIQWRTRPPTTKPSAAPTFAPSKSPTRTPTATPTAVPSVKPTPAPTAVPTTAAPTAIPTLVPTAPPSRPPTKAPTAAPTCIPSAAPTAAPTFALTDCTTACNIATSTNIALATGNTVALISLATNFRIQFSVKLITLGTNPNIPNILDLRDSANGVVLYRVSITDQRNLRTEYAGASYHSYGPTVMSSYSTAWTTVTVTHVSGTITTFSDGDTYTDTNQITTSQIDTTGRTYYLSLGGPSAPTASGTVTNIIITCKSKSMSVDCAPQFAERYLRQLTFSCYSCLALTGKPTSAPSRTPTRLPPQKPPPLPTLAHNHCRLGCTITGATSHQPGVTIARVKLSTNFRIQFYATISVFLDGANILQLRDTRNNGISLVDIGYGANAKLATAYNGATDAYEGAYLDAYPLETLVTVTYFNGMISTRSSITPQVTEFVTSSGSALDNTAIEYDLYLCAVSDTMAAGVGQVRDISISGTRCCIIMRALKLFEA
jgi:hypothetical protein